MSLINVKNPLEMSGLYVVYPNAGSIYEKKGRRGTSHLMEHMVCHAMDSMRDKLQQNGITSNAFTADEVVVFHLTGLSSRLPKFVNEYVDLLTGGVEKITEEQFLNERSTVLQEYGDCFADPIYCTLLNGMRYMYGSYGAIGERSDIEQFSFQDFKDTYESVFRKPGAIFYVGPEAIDVKADYAEMGELAPLQLSYSPEFAKSAVFETKPEVNRRSVSYFTKELVSKEDAPAVKLAVNMLTAGLNSPLYKEIREKRGLSYFSVGEPLPLRDGMHLCFIAATEPEKEAQLRDVYADVLGNLDGYMTEERFIICHDMALVKEEKTKILQYNDPDSLIRASFNFVNPDAVKECNLTFDKVMDAARRYLSLDKLELYVS